MIAVADAMKGTGKTINGKEVTPKVLNNYLMKNNGYQGNLYVWAKIEKFGFRYMGQTRDTNYMKTLVCQGNKILILNIDNGGHWVLATGMNEESKSFTILDGWKMLDRTSVKYSEVKRAGIYEVQK